MNLVDKEISTSPYVLSDNKMEVHNFAKKLLNGGLTNSRKFNFKKKGNTFRSGKVNEKFIINVLLDQFSNLQVSKVEIIYFNFESPDQIVQNIKLPDERELLIQCFKLLKVWANECFGLDQPYCVSTYEPPSNDSIESFFGPQPEEISPNQMIVFKDEINAARPNHLSHDVKVGTLRLSK